MQIAGIRHIAALVNYYIHPVTPEQRSPGFCPWTPLSHVSPSLSFAHFGIYVEQCASRNCACIGVILAKRDNYMLSAKFGAN